MITKDNLLFSTFIGLSCEIVNSSQRSLVGLKGTITDETKNLIVIEVPQKDGEDSEEAKGAREIKIPKVSSTFRFTTEDGKTVDVEGKDIAFRPYERPKKV